MLNILHIIIYCHAEQAMMVQSYHCVDDFIFQASPWVAGKDVDCKAMSGSGRPGPSHRAESVHKINLWEKCEFLRELLWISNFHLSAEYIFVAKVMRRCKTFSPDWGNENGFHRSWFGFGCCSSQFTVTKSWTGTVLACDDGLNMKRLCLNHIIFICRNKDTCLKGTKGWCLTEGRIR